MAGKSVIFCWVRDLTGLPGNKAANTATKAAALNAALFLNKL
jgi:hypothetical protein